MEHTEAHLYAVVTVSSFAQRLPVLAKEAVKRGLLEVLPGGQRAILLTVAFVARPAVTSPQVHYVRHCRTL